MHSVGTFFLSVLIYRNRINLHIIILDALSGVHHTVVIQLELFTQVQLQEMTQLGPPLVLQPQLELLLDVLSALV